MSGEEETFEQNALSATKKLVRLCLHQNNPNETLPQGLWNEDTVLIYPGHMSTIKAAGSLGLSELIAIHAGHAELIDEWYQVQPLEQGLCSVYGTVWWREVWANVDDLTCIDKKVQLSVLFQQTGSHPCIVSLHYTPVEAGEHQSSAQAGSDLLLRDSLTGLLNRDGLKQQICTDLEKPFSPSAYLMLDIDHFKTINNTYGHRTGDHVLTQVARRLEESFRATDVKGRIGGNEFIIFMWGVSSRQAALERVELLRRRLREPIVFENAEISVACSIGVVFTNRPGMAFDELYGHADQAMYQAKQLGRDQYFIYAGPTVAAQVQKTPQSKAALALDSQPNQGIHRRQMIAGGILLVSLLLVLITLSVQYLTFLQDTVQRDANSNLTNWASISHRASTQIFRAPVIRWREYGWRSPCIISNKWVQSMSEQDLMLNLTNTTFAPRYLVSVMSEFNDEGQVYALPLPGTTRLVLYHPDILEAYGVEPPQSVPELLEACKELSSNGQKAIFVDGSLLQMLLQTYHLAYPEGYQWIKQSHYGAGPHGQPYKPAKANPLCGRRCHYPAAVRPNDRSPGSRGL